MSEIDSPEVYVLNRLTPTIRGKVQRLLSEAEERNKWAADHFNANGGSACATHPNLPRSGTGDSPWSGFMEEDGLTPENPKDAAYLQRWYLGPVEVERSRRVADARAVLDYDRLRTHAALHAADAASLADHAAELHADPNFRGGLHGHRVLVNGSTAPKDTAYYPSTEQAEDLRLRARLRSLGGA